MNRDERVTLQAYRCLYPDVVEIGGATVLRGATEQLVPQHPPGRVRKGRGDGQLAAAEELLITSSP